MLSSIENSQMKRVKDSLKRRCGKNGVVSGLCLAVYDSKRIYALERMAISKIQVKSAVGIPTFLINLATRNKFHYQI